MKKEETIAKKIFKFNGSTGRKKLQSFCVFRKFAASQTNDRHSNKNINKNQERLLYFARLCLLRFAYLIQWIYIFLPIKITMNVNHIDKFVSNLFIFVHDVNDFCV